ncbi:uncharacterized protein K452DRAFT_359788 [Aplosporella prunicola CBS 121167]|uniref:Lysophospholipase n=1 Tax=Aplosporella prunicola CBS 121167 TaxID=1176127 RepID=A0A6A6BC21_9PEZI|nr:uncharacterized protein K452DRAFT_359788 [Aplosporella prunicola CBS 121167]KAF2140794.1 hypothetical protein K452DRAFT_359788 [Aplosporella prunicola CBS 121167]
MATLSGLAAVSFFITSAFASGYAPVKVTCPSTQLVREASNGVSSAELEYIAARKNIADTALSSWLTKTNPAYENVSNFPTLGLTSSGGGLRALLCGAGVVQGMDGRDGNYSTSGLYQALTYHAGLSGGSWLLSSIAGNDWPTVSSLRDDLWTKAFEETLFFADGLLGSLAINGDLLAKHIAGFPPTLTDPWGRLLSYQLLQGEDGGVAKTLSGLRDSENFTSYNVPFPIIQARGVKTFEGACDPTQNSTIYEFTPYEFGSWDEGVAAFVKTEYLGSSLTNGKPTKNSSCITNYDNLGYVFGTSSSLFNQICSPLTVNNSDIGQHLSGFLLEVHEIVTRDVFAPYPNPFYKYDTASFVAEQEELALVDGGEIMQNNPIWPMLHRDIDVLFVNDNSADTDFNWPNGSEMVSTYNIAKEAGLARMPEIPSTETFVSEGLNVRPTFFGCNDTNVMTIVYLPNAEYDHASNTTTLTLKYLAEQTEAIIGNNVQVVTQGEEPEWAGCLACGIMAKTNQDLPEECTSCLNKYCYN